MKPDFEGRKIYSSKMESSYLVVPIVCGANLAFRCHKKSRPLLCGFYYQDWGIFDLAFIQIRLCTRT